MPRPVYTRLCVLFYFVLSVGASSVWADTAVYVTYSHRLVPSGAEPDTTISEGGIEATFSGENPIDLLNPVPGIDRINDNSFAYVFPWYQTESLEISFVDSAGDTTYVSAFPEPVMPLMPVLHDLPIMHVQTDLANLWDPEIGIYVWGNHDNFLQHGSEWEREATLDYLVNGNLEFSEDIGIRIQGHSSRIKDQKGLRLVFEGYGSNSAIDYDLFNSTPTEFSNLILRTGRWPGNLIYSQFAETLFQDLGHLTVRYTPVAVYLNNEYWGLYCLRERYDEQFIENTHQIEDDYILIKDDEAVVGELEVWDQFLESVRYQQDCTSHQWYQSVCSQLDIASYIDWLFVNIFGATYDNGYWWNLALLKKESTPWQFMMWDEDAILNSQNLEANHFKLYTASTEADFEAALPPLFSLREWSDRMALWNSLLRQLMHNSEFKAHFKVRTDTLMATEMSIANMVDRLNWIGAGQGPELPLHAQRWSGFWVPGYYNNLNEAIDWVADRHPIVTAQLADFMENYRVAVELSHFTATYQSSGIVLDWHTESEQDNQGFILYRGIDSPDNMVPIATYLVDPELLGAGTTFEPTDYQFTDLNAPPGAVLFYQLHYVLSDGTSTEVNWIESVVSTSLDGLIINELMADNDNTIVDELGESDDWFELFNGTGAPISLDGFYLTDDLLLPTKHLLTATTDLPVDGYRLLWADSQINQGPLHVNFKLSADGDELALFAPDGTTLIDHVVFDAQFEDHVYQRDPANPDEWSYGWDPSPLAMNEPSREFEFLIMNEMMSNNTNTIMDEVGDYDSWLEIHNPLPVAISLENLTLSETPGGIPGWSLPNNNIEARTYQIIWLDNQTENGPYHASFILPPHGGFVGLFAPDMEIITNEICPSLLPDEAYARVPDGGIWQITDLATPGNANPATLNPLVVINEFMAKNDHGIQDEHGSCEDWVEIYNPGSEPVDLAGRFLTDDLSNTIKWAFPPIILAAGEFLIVWCDDEPSEGPLHTNFKLSASGEEIGLFDSVINGNNRLDSIEFGGQTSDISMGRETDAGLPWIFFPTPTPGATNVDLTLVNELPVTSLVLRDPYPNPFNPITNIEFSLPHSGQVQIDVFDVRGICVARLLDQHLSEGYHHITWSGQNTFRNQVASGTYFVRLSLGLETRIKSILLIK